MLSPNDIQAIANDITDIYSRVESECIKDIVRHLSSGKGITQAHVWQMKKLNDVGMLKRELITHVHRSSNVAIKDVEKLIDEALSRSYVADMSKIKKGLSEYKVGTVAERLAEVKQSDAFQRILKAATAGCKDAMNLTGTRAIQASVKAYTDAVNGAYLEVVTGNYTMDEAVKRAVGKIGQSGIKIVDSKDKATGNELVKLAGTHYTTYKTASGTRIYPLDSAIRRDITTAINRSCAQLTLDSCGDMGAELVETTWHVGARPEHEVWQGRIFSLNPKDTRYPYFYASQESGGTGYGDMLGLCGINCYHSFNPYFEGSERAEQENKPTAEENAQAYKEQQAQRAYERNLRSLKREQMAYQDAGYTDKAQDAQRRVNDMSARYRQFLKDTGRTRISMLDKVSGYKRISTKPNATVPPSTTTAPTTPTKPKPAPKPKEMLAGVAKGKPMTFEEADEFRANPEFGNLAKGSDINCQTCVVANEMRRRGFDVEAKLFDYKNPSQVDLMYNTRKAWIDPTTGTLPKKLYDMNNTTTKRCMDFVDRIVQEGERYHMRVGWRGRSSGHIVCLDRINGELRMFDPQSGRITVSKQNMLTYFKYFKITTTSTFYIYRVDNLEMNKAVVEAVLKPHKP